METHLKTPLPIEKNLSPQPTKAKRKTILITTLGILVAAVVIGAGTAVYSYTKPQTSPDSRIQVVAGENFWGDIAAQIGGDNVTVTSIISDPTIDPHLYESDAKNAASLTSAQLVIENGFGYDDFLDKLLAAAPNSNRRLLSTQTVLQLSANTNPHVWYDPTKVAVIATAIAGQLSQIDPGQTNLFSHNLQQFTNSLSPIVTTLSEIKAKYPAAPVAYTERVPGYLLVQAGLTVASPEGFSQAMEDGNDPSPADTLTMDTLISEKKVKVLLYNSQATSAVTQHLRDLATQAGVPVVAVTETMPANQAHFQDWQLRVTKAVLAALGD